MNVWIASDIHGSALYCRKLLDLVERQGGGRLVLLGDLCTTAPGTICRRAMTRRPSLPC